MDRAEKNRQLILEFFQLISGVEKSKKLIGEFVKDPKLVETFILFERHCPEYYVIVDELTVEKNRIIVQARAKGKLVMTDKLIELPFVLGCRMAQEKIVNHWFMANELSLMKQIDELEINNLETPKI